MFLGLSITGCSLNDTYKHTNIITNLNMQNNNVLIECGVIKYLYFPQTNKLQRNDGAYRSIKLIQIE